MTPEIFYFCAYLVDLSAFIVLVVYWVFCYFSLQRWRIR